MSDCVTCPVEKHCGYKYKPCDCVHMWKFTPKIKSEDDVVKPIRIKTCMSCYYVYEYNKYKVCPFCGHPKTLPRRTKKDIEQFNRAFGLIK